MKRTRNGCSGQVLPLVAVMLFAFLVLAALAIDVGMLYTARTSAQHAADAAALAGAYTFLNSAAVQPGAAQQAAISVSASNDIYRTSTVITAGDVTVDVANRRVTVKVSRAGASGIPTFFARVIGTQLVDLSATATAEAAESGSGNRCVKPIYLPNTILSAQLPSKACTAGETIFDASGAITAYAQSNFGKAVNVRPSDPAQALAPGQFYSLDFGSGAQTYSCALGSCLSQCGMSPDVVECGAAYPLKTGAMVGPTRQGIDELTGNPADTFVAIGQYRDAAGNVMDSSRSLAVTPVWDNCKQTVSPGYAGQTVKIIGFVNVFIDGMQGNQVVGHVVGATACASAGSGTGGGTGGGAFGAGTGPMARPVRLVN